VGNLGKERIRSCRKRSRAQKNISSLDCRLRVYFQILGELKCKTGTMYHPWSHVRFNSKDVSWRSGASMDPFPCPDPPRRCPASIPDQEWLLSVLASKD
jgi:hypothetical protein